MIKPNILRAGLMLSCASLSLCLGFANPAGAQNADEKLNLPANSPFRNPDIIYLEADEVQDNRDAGIITAKGGVEGRYQDRTLRADQVVYNVNSGRVVATGNVVLIGGDGSSQFADKIELTDKLASGAAKDFTARFNPVGIAGAKYAVRRSDTGYDLYNAYYTACEACSEDGEDKKPTWRIRARKVTQDVDDKMIHYRDAVVEVKGVPVLYLPYMAHPDPSTERRSGLLMPYGGRSGTYGFFYEQPYYLALSPYSEATITPRLMERATPLIMGEYNRKFNSGLLEVSGSFTKDTFFDNDGDPFTADDLLFANGDRTASKQARLTDDTWRSHLFARGQFELNDTLTWGFGLQNATDDFYLDRYDIDEPDADFGLYNGGTRRLTQQLYGVAQQDNFRYAASTYGFESLRSVIRRNEDTPTNVRIVREDDSRLPLVLPKIELDHYFNVPGIGGRLHGFADAVQIKRDFDGTLTTPDNGDYKRITFGADYSKTMIVPGGIEVTPFAMVRNDNFEIDPLSADSIDEQRTIGHVGLDARWTFIRPGASVDLTLEPRIQITESFGDDGISPVLAFQEDSIGIDLDSALLWDRNKSTGYDLWQTGTRTDVGASLAGDWGDNRASLFLGRSYLDSDINQFDVNSGLSGDESDIVAESILKFGRKFNAGARLRYDDDGNELRRIDTNLNYIGERLKIRARYYKINNPFIALQRNLVEAPPEEISGMISYDFSKNWGVRYSGFRDIDAGLTRREELALVFDDDCTYLELFYERRRSLSTLTGDTSGFGIRIALLTLGEVEND